MTASVIVSRAT